MASIIYALFNKHTYPVYYDEMIQILKEHPFIVSDWTRMHRKLSEVRQFVKKLHPSLEEFILNTRGTGYSLPLHLKNLHQIGTTQKDMEFVNKKITDAMHVLENLINEAIDITSKNKVIKQGQNYLMDRNSVRHILVEKLSTFNKCEKIILKEIRTHEADFTGLRIGYLLAKIKTYVGLARISEYPISEAQWLDWFIQEIWLIFNELKKLIKATEGV